MLQHLCWLWMTPLSGTISLCMLTRDCGCLSHTHTHTPCQSSDGVDDNVYNHAETGRTSVNWTLSSISALQTQQIFQKTSWRWSRWIRRWRKVCSLWTTLARCSLITTSTLTSTCTARRTTATPPSCSCLWVSCQGSCTKHCVLYCNSLHCKGYYTQRFLLVVSTVHGFTF